MDKQRHYNSLTLDKLLPKNGDGQLKYICVDKKANTINILTEKFIHDIRTMAVLEVMITQHPRAVVKHGWGNLKSMMATWLCCVVEKTTEQCIVSCIVLFAKNMKTGWSTFYVFGLLFRVIKKLAMSWIMPCFALFLHTVL